MLALLSGSPHVTVPKIHFLKLCLGSMLVELLNCFHEQLLLLVRIGYLTCNLFLHKDHELMLLLINTMQRDLQSANHIEARLPTITKENVKRGIGVVLNGQIQEFFH